MNTKIRESCLYVILTGTAWLPPDGCSSRLLNTAEGGDTTPVKNPRNSAPELDRSRSL